MEIMVWDWSGRCESIKWNQFDEESVIMSESSFPPMAEFINLLLCCPKEDTPERCPFCEIRKLSFEQKVNWIMTQSNDEVYDTLSFHQGCMGHSVDRHQNLTQVDKNRLGFCSTSFSAKKLGKDENTDSWIPYNPGLPQPFVAEGLRHTSTV